jgi:hypothetical protein
MTRDEFISGMHLMNKCLNLADQCQPILMQYLSEQETPLDKMNGLEFIAVEPTLLLILQPVIQKIEEFKLSEMYKAAANEGPMYVPGLVIPE